MRSIKLAATLLVAAASCLTVQARPRDAPFHGNVGRSAAAPLVSTPDTPVTSRNGTQLPPYTTVYFFDQLIDHTNPRLGTFKQRYWHTWEFYEPGGPIILNTPGEVAADGYSGYLTNRTINGVLAQELNGSTIVLEHRFYGQSNPYPDLSVKSLRVHTIQQAIDDLEYFAENANLPMPNGDNVTPDKAPWIMIGGSYAGALTSWAMVNKPNLFHAGYASSAVVEAITDFWGYFEPIRQNMPANCSADVQAVISHIDTVFMGKNATAIQSIKDNFGLGNLTHLDDVVSALRNNLWDWQALQITSGPNTQFFRFCDALEVKDGEVASASGWGLDHALAAWGSYWRSYYLDNLCDEDSDSIEECLGTYDPTLSYWTNTTAPNSNRSWFWIVCNEVGFLQDSAPVGKPTLVSRLLNPPYDYRQCQYMFPEAFPIQIPPRAAATNLKYRGWNVKIDRLFFANGIRDPWREATLSVNNGTRFTSTPTQPIDLGDGFHCSDLGISASVDPTIAMVQKNAVASMQQWMKQFRPRPGIPSHPGPRPTPHPSLPILPPVKPIKPINAWFRKTGSV